MSWARIDDAYPDHPKVVALERMGRLGLDAEHLWFRGCLYASRLGDPGIPRHRVGTAIGPILGPKRGRLAAEALVSVGLWDRDGDDYRVHDFEDYQGRAAPPRPTQPTTVAPDINAMSGEDRRAYLDTLPRATRKKVLKDANNRRARGKSEAQTAPQDSASGAPQERLNEAQTAPQSQRLTAPHEAPLSPTPPIPEHNPIPNPREPRALASASGSASVSTSGGAKRASGERLKVELMSHEDESPGAPRARQIRDQFHDAGLHLSPDAMRELVTICERRYVTGIEVEHVIATCAAKGKRSGGYAVSMLRDDPAATPPPTNRPQPRDEMAERIAAAKRQLKGVKTFEDELNEKLAREREAAEAGAGGQPA